MAALARAFRVIEEIPDQPKVIIADTVKGKGVTFMEGPALKPGDLYGYHSGAPSEESYVAGLAELLASANALFGELGLGPVKTEHRTRNPRRESKKTDNLIAAYDQALMSQAARRPEIAVLDADLVKDCGLVSFARKYPDRFIECGIAEQDMVSTAAGMARRGALPIVHSFACFLSARPNEQIYNQCSEGSKVLYVGSLAGLLPGGPGHSHQSVRDISALAAVPNLLMAEPCCELELRALFDHLVHDVSGSAYLRLVSVKWPMPFDYPRDHRVEVGKGWIVKDGGDAVVFGYGPWLMANAFDAAEEVEKSTGATIRLIAMPWLNRVDTQWLRQVIGARRSIITLDNHYVHGGQGEMLAAAIATLGLEPTAAVARVGVTELPVCGTNDEVLAHHELDVAGLVKALRHVVPQIA
jgi:transketolase